MTKPRRIGSRVGKHQQKSLRVAVAGSKYVAGGSTMKKKRGGYMRKPKPPVRYKRARSNYGF